MVRASALRISIDMILRAPLEKDGETTVIRVGSELVNRVNVMGTVVNFLPQESRLVLDDGSATIAVQWFEGVRHVAVGDLVVLIGRVREFNDRYIFPEVLKIVSDRRWLDVRRKELTHQLAMSINAASAAHAAVSTVPDPSTIDAEERALKVIHERDHGDGVNIDEVIGVLGSSGEETIKRLLMAGEIFEVKPGRLRLL